MCRCDAWNECAACVTAARAAAARAAASTCEGTHGIACESKLLLCPTLRVCVVTSCVFASGCDEDDRALLARAVAIAISRCMVESLMDCGREGGRGPFRGPGGRDCSGAGAGACRAGPSPGPCAGAGARAASASARVDVSVDVGADVGARPDDDACMDIWL